MVDKFSSFATTLVCGILIITLIEMVLPNGKNRKYVKLICSLVLTIIIINPILGLFNSEINIDEYLKETKVTMANTEYKAMAERSKENQIRSTYEKNMKLDVIDKLKDMGYGVNDVELNINDETYEIDKISLNLTNDDGSIQPVIIDVSSNLKSDISEVELAKIKDYINSIYGVSKSNILINR